MKLCAMLGLWCATLIGPAVVHDGDTLKVNGQSVRLAGIDAEELNEPHGDAARRAMVAITQGKIVECAPTGAKSYKRIVATCAVPGDPEANGPRQLVDVGALLVMRGYALDCGRYSGGKYRQLEPAGVRAILIQKPYC